MKKFVAISITIAIILLLLGSYAIFWHFFNAPKEVAVKEGIRSVVVRWGNVFPIGFSHFEVRRQEQGGHEPERIGGHIRGLLPNTHSPQEK
jgi:flagellar basal body-associated protein FliL